MLLLYSQFITILQDGSGLPLEKAKDRLHLCTNVISETKIYSEGGMHPVNPSDALRAMSDHAIAWWAGAEGEAGADQAMQVVSVDAAATSWVAGEIRCREATIALRQHLRIPGTRCNATL